MLLQSDRYFHGLLTLLTAAFCLLAGLFCFTPSAGESFPHSSIAFETRSETDLSSLKNSDIFFTKPYLPISWPPNLQKSLHFFGWNKRPDLEEGQREILLSLDGMSISAFEEEKEILIHPLTSHFFTEEGQGMSLFWEEVEDEVLFRLVPPKEWGELQELHFYLAPSKPSPLKSSELPDLRFFGADLFQKEHTLSEGDQFCFLLIQKNQSRFFSLAPSQSLYLVNEEWQDTVPEGDIQNYPLLTIDALEEEYCLLTYYLAHGSKVHQWKLLADLEAKSCSSLIEDVRLLKINSPQLCSLDLGGTSFRAKAGDWFLLEDWDWKALDRLEDLQDFAEGRRTGTLLTIEGIHSKEHPPSVEIRTLSPYRTTSLSRRLHENS